MGETTDTLPKGRLLSLSLPVYMVLYTSMIIKSCVEGQSVAQKHAQSTGITTALMSYH